MIFATRHTPEGDLRYAMDWQNFNRLYAYIFQVNLGVLGEEAYAEALQTWMHEDLLAQMSLWVETTKEKPSPLSIGIEIARRLGMGSGSAITMRYKFTKKIERQQKFGSQDQSD